MIEIFNEYTLLLNGITIIVLCFMVLFISFQIRQMSDRLNHHGDWLMKLTTPKHYKSKLNYAPRSIKLKLKKKKGINREVN